MRQDFNSELWVAKALLLDIYMRYFSDLPKNPLNHLLNPLNHIQIWQMSPQLTCNDTSKYDLY